MFDFNLLKSHKSSSSQAVNKNGTAFFYEENATSKAVLVCQQRMVWAFIGFIFLYAVIAWRIFDLCLVNGIKIARLDTQTDKPTVNTPVSFKRADITDRNGTVIATSLPTDNLIVEKKSLRGTKDYKDVAQKLADIFPEMQYESILNKIRQSNRLIIKRNLSPAQKKAVNDLGNPALVFEESEKRVYPHKNLLSHVLGYTTIDNVGLAGVEKGMQKRLTESSKPLQLTVDLGVQDTIREELQAAVKQHNALGASAILMDVHTGEVIAMVSLPDFDPNLSIPVGDRALFNFPTQGVYEAGSVFKTFNTALGLESGKVKVTDKFDATKTVKLHGITVAGFHEPHKWLSPGEILIHSSNIGSALMVDRVGRQAQRQFLMNMGFSERLSDFEIAEKERPIFLSEKNWRDGNMITISYGYAISVTPLHLISAFSALVNGGIYNYPTIIKGSNTHQPRRVISEETSEHMRHLLRDVVTEGSGKKANVIGYEVAGKTGTANKSINGKYKDKVVINTFLSTFPASNPQYALLVVFDEPKASKETAWYATCGWNAVPTSGKIIEAIAPQLNLQANFDIDKQKQNIKAAYKR